MEHTQLANDIKRAYEVLAEVDAKEAKRLAEIEMSKRRIAKEGLMNGSRIPDCRCLSCITAICMYEKPNLRKCEKALRDPGPRTPDVDME
jgi:hypothetical protein